MSKQVSKEPLLLRSHKKTLFLIILPLLSVINTVLGEEQLLLLLTEPYFYCNLLWNVFTIGVVITFLIYGYQHLGKDIKSMWLRLLFISSLSSLLSTISTIFYISVLWNQSIWDYPEFFNYDLINYIIWQYAFLSALHFYSKSKARDPDFQVIESPPEKEILVIKKGQTLSLSSSDICAAHLRHGIVFCTDYEGNTYKSNYTIREIRHILSQNHFFHANRQLITSRKFVKGFKALEHRKIEIVPRFSLSTNLTVSKEKSPAFKNWWQSGAV
jgi:hypothetical protein